MFDVNTESKNMPCGIDYKQIHKLFVVKPARAVPSPSKLLSKRLQLDIVVNLTLKACSDEAYDFNHRYYNRDNFVLKGRS